MTFVALELRVRVRTMVWDDSESVRGLCSQLGYPSAADDFQKRLLNLRENLYQEIFVAEVQDHASKIVGWAHVYEAPTLLSAATAELGGLVVARDYQKRGIGRALIDALDEWGHVRGMQSLLLATRADRLGSKAFYKKLGFSRDYDATYLRRSIYKTRAA